MKRCSVCKELKDEIEYNIRRPGAKNKHKAQLRSACKVCESITHTDWRHRNPWEARVRKYGLTPSEFELMLAGQRNCCKVCGAPITIHSLHVDHNHRTGRVRGMLCCSCNQFIGHLEKSETRLQSALNYLQEC